MEEKPFDSQSRLAKVVLGLVCLSVGAMFFLPGLFFLKRILKQIFIAQTCPDGILVFVTMFIFAIGIILILLAFKFFQGTIKGQYISVPVLIFASSFFILMSIVLFIMTFILKIGTGGQNVSRAIGGGFTIGILGLWAAIKRKKGK